MSVLSKLIYKDRKFYRNVTGIALPIALQGLITTGVNMMDTVMVGAVGETELSAVSLANSFINVFQILCMGIGMGASVLVSRYYGMGEQTSMRKAIGIMLRLCGGIAALFSLAMLFFPEQIMRIYTGDEAIIGQGVLYLRWSVATCFLLGLSVTCAVILRCVEQVKIPLYASIFAFFLNVGANYVFIFGHFGMPRMGVAGAALGTLIARIFETGIICAFLFRKEKQIGFRLRHLFMPVGDLWREYLRICIPVLISDGIYALGNNSVAMVIGRLGESFVAANAVTSVTQQLSSVMIQGFAQAAAIVTGRTLGEGDRKKAQDQGYALLGLGFAFGILAAVIIMIISEPMIRAYGVSPQTAEIARALMRAISMVVVFQCTNSIMTKGTLRGGGDTKVLMVADNIFLWLFSIPLGALAGLVWHWPAFWIYTLLKVDQILKCIWCVWRLHSGKWIKKIATAGEKVA